MKVYLVTTKQTDEDYGDDLFIEGVYSSYEKAKSACPDYDYYTGSDYTITEMTVDKPEEDYKQKENAYPFAYYYE
ncbi:unnamed protein product [Fructobacillus fructosus]|uniref:DUF7336 domain-containing protein n=1 Tax=Fructobacillus fructosus TaxID=1631 RepID=A0ABM9MZK3_9LACO|nr:unnamed protein product [Fructobacillus fructosus]